MVYKVNFLRFLFHISNRCTWELEFKNDVPKRCFYIHWCVPSEVPRYLLKIGGWSVVLRHLKSPLLHTMPSAS